MKEERRKLKVTQREYYTARIALLYARARSVAREAAIGGARARGHEIVFAGFEPYVKKVVSDAVGDNLQYLKQMLNNEVDAELTLRESMYKMTYLDPIMQTIKGSYAAIGPLSCESVCHVKGGRPVCKTETFDCQLGCAERCEAECAQHACACTGARERGRESPLASDATCKWQPNFCRSAPRRESEQRGARPMGAPALLGLSGQRRPQQACGSRPSTIADATRHPSQGAQR